MLLATSRLDADESGQRYSEREEDVWATTSPTMGLIPGFINTLWVTFNGGHAR